MLSINECVNEAAARSGVDAEEIWAEVRTEFGRITGMPDHRKSEVAAFIDGMFPGHRSAPSYNTSILTDSEATRMECWRDRSKPCSARRCMAWRVLRVLGPDMEPVELHRADDDGMIAMGRCSALPE